MRDPSEPAAWLPHAVETSPSGLGGRLRAAAILLTLLAGPCGVAEVLAQSSGAARPAGDPRLDEAAAALRDDDAPRAAALAEAVLASAPHDAEALVLLARAARHGGDLLAAENRLEGALAGAAAADRGRLWLELGLVRLARGQTLALEGRGTRSTIVALFRDAAAALETARELGATGDELTVGLADALEWAEQGADAERVLREGIAASGDSIALRSALAMHLLRQPAREEEGRELARVVLDRGGRPADQVALLSALGRSELASGSVERAFDAYGRVLEAWPGLQEVYDDVWAATAGRRRMDVAERLLSLVVARFPLDSKAPYYRGHARLLEGRFAEAIADFSAAIALSAGFREARLGLAEARRRAGDRDGAAAALREILVSSPSDAAALDALRDVAVEMAFSGNDAGALPHFETITLARPSDREARVNWAVACARTGRTAESRRILEAGLALDPRDARLRNELGIAHESVGNHVDAEREYRAALDGGFEFDAAENLAMLLLRRGRVDEALPVLRDVLRRDPGRLRSALAYESATRSR